MSQIHTAPTVTKRWDEFLDENPPLAYAAPDELIRCLPDVFVTSDNHWFHHNIIRFQERPWNADELMTERWNATVGAHATVLHCGDVVHRCTLEHVTTHLPPLNGDKYLLRGNHDRQARALYFANHGWRLVQPFTAPYRDWFVLFTHRPVPMERLPQRTINVHGHIHRHPPQSTRHINVSVERWDYTPVRLGRLLDDAIAQQGA